MSLSEMSPQKRAFVFLGAVLSFSIVIYVAIGLLVTVGSGKSARPGTEAFGTFLLCTGFVFLVVALLLAPRERPNAGDRPPMTPSDVRGRGWIALMVSEAAAVVGFAGTFITMRPVLVLLLGAGAIAANLFWILPQGARLIEAGETAAAVRPFGPG